MDNGNTPRVPSFYNAGELVSLEQWKQEFANDKDRVVVGLDRDKDLSPYVNHILSNYFLIETDIRRMINDIVMYKDDNYIEHVGMLNLFIFQFVNKRIS